jgi:hypothetical protein
MGMNERNILSSHFPYELGERREIKGMLHRETESGDCFFLSESGKGTIDEAARDHRKMLGINFLEKG